MTDQGRPNYVSQQAVAERAGVSQSTVQRVLAGQYVGAGLRVRVEDAVAELGYRPNLKWGRPTESENTDGRS